MKYLFVSLLLPFIISANSDYSFYTLLQPAKVGECYPVSPYTKKHISVVETWFYVERVFTCQYACVDKTKNEIPHIATSKIRDWLWEDSYSFVCEGYRENMRWVHKPDLAAGGRYDYFGASPFLAKNSILPELREWYFKNINPQKNQSDRKMDLIEFHDIKEFINPKK